MWFSTTSFLNFLRNNLIFWCVFSRGYHIHFPPFLLCWILYAVLLGVIVQMDENRLTTSSFFLLMLKISKDHFFRAAINMLFCESPIRIFHAYRNNYIYLEFQCHDILLVMSAVLLEKV